MMVLYVDVLSTIKNMIFIIIVRYEGDINIHGPQSSDKVSYEPNKN